MVAGQQPEPQRQQQLEAFLAGLRGAGTSANTLGLFSAHQMGTCRMGYSPASSVVDADGECWELDDLFVMDASTFPTARSRFSYQDYRMLSLSSWDRPSFCTRITTYCCPAPGPITCTWGASAALSPTRDRRRVFNKTA